MYRMYRMCGIVSRTTSFFHSLPYSHRLPFDDDASRRAQSRATIKHERAVMKGRRGAARLSNWLYASARDAISTWTEEDGQESFNGSIRPIVDRFTGRTATKSGN